MPLGTPHRSYRRCAPSGAPRSDGHPKSKSIGDTLLDGRDRDDGAARTILETILAVLPDWVEHKMAARSKSKAASQVAWLMASATDVRANSRLSSKFLR